MKYQILEHKADLKIRAFGKNQEEVFSNLLYGMIEAMRPELKEPEESSIKTIEVKSFDLPALLVDFLSEALYQIQADKEVFKDIQFDKITETELKAKVIAKKVQGFGEEVKAVTHHDLEIIKDNSTWRATVLFDI